MKLSINQDVLLRGSLAHAVKARLFQRDAVTLCDNGSFSSSVVLGTIALEHISTARWLLELSNDSKQIAGLTSNSFRKQFDDATHVQRIARSVHSSPVVPHGAAVLEKLFKYYALPLEAEGRLAMAQDVQQMLAKEIDSFPVTTHRLREDAQYIKFNSRSLTWKQATPSKSDTRFALEAVARKYSAFIHKLCKQGPALELVAKLDIKELYDKTGIWPSSK